MTTRQLEGAVVAVLSGGLGSIATILEQYLHDGGSPDWTRLGLSFGVGAVTGLVAWLRTPPAKDN